MERVVIVGRGASGKSTLAVRLGGITTLPVVELDKLFWQADLRPIPHDQWAAMQCDLFQRPGWIADGDLGPHDVLDIRLRAADTVVMLDFSLLRCGWRALRRSREAADFWRWLWTYRRRWRPLVMEAIVRQAASADVHVLRNPRSVNRWFVARVAREAAGRSDASESGRPARR